MTIIHCQFCHLKISSTLQACPKCNAAIDLTKGARPRGARPRVAYAGIAHTGIAHPEISSGTKSHRHGLLLGVPALMLGCMAAFAGMTAVVRPLNVSGLVLQNRVSREVRAARLETLALADRNERIEALEAGEGVVISEREKEYTQGDDSLTAWIQAQRLVERRLRSPHGTAWPTNGFQEGQDRQEYVIPRGDGVYDVRAWVDAPNGRGGSIRTDFSAQVARDGEGTWRLTSFLVH